MTRKREKIEYKKDSIYEGREEYFIDTDRMINEGLAGGKVDFVHYDHPQIEQARDFSREDPPNEQ